MWIINSFKWSWYAALVLLLMAISARAGELVDRDFPGLSYPDSDQRDFYVYIPDSYDGETALPLVMVLHGCRQTRDTIFDEFGWDEAAERHGFIVVAPDISTRDLLRFPQCWGYWEPKEIHQGQGEVEDLHRIALQVEQEWRIDPDRRHIAGLSSGGFMANAAAVAHNEYWASAGVHSGGGYNETAGTYSATCASPRESSGQFKSPAAIAADMGNEMDDDYTIPVMLVHSQNDCAVGYGVEGDATEWGGLTANRDAWLAVSGGTLVATSDCSRSGIECSHLKYGTNQRSTVEVVTFVGLVAGTDANKGHYWSGGKTEGQWTTTRGPKAAALFYEFFQRHSRSNCEGCPAAPTGLTATHVGESDAVLSWNANTEADLAGYHLYRDGAKVNAAPMGQTHYTDNELQPARTYTYALTAITVDGMESPPSAPLAVQTLGLSNCRSYTLTLAEHVARGHAYTESRCVGWWCWIWPWANTIEYYAAGSDTYLGNDAGARVTLYTEDDVYFSTTDCTPGQ